jgi:hypothetical protein
MRILLDESLPVEFRVVLPDHDVHSVGEMGWSGLKNGELLIQAARTFDVMLTADQNIEFQQNLQRLPIAVVVLIAYRNLSFPKIRSP